MHATLRIWLPAVVAGLLAVGCSSSEPASNAAPPVAEDLADVRGLLVDYTAEHAKGPTKLAHMAKNQSLYSRGYAAVQSGAIVVVWGVPMPAEGGGTDVIAYEKKVETEGGSVLLQNGTIEHMSAGEFKAAPKAK